MGTPEIAYKISYALEYGEKSEYKVYYVPDISYKRAVKSIGGLDIVEHHEMWHLKQVEGF